MTDEERRTPRGTFEAPELGDEGDQSITEPALEPAPRLDDTPVARPPRDRGLRTNDPGPRAIDLQSAERGAQVEELDEEAIDTWRPPPPAPLPVAAVAGTAADASSIAPRELSQRQPPGRRAAMPLLGAALLLLGVGTFLVRRAERNQSEPARTEPARPALAPGLAAATPVAPTPSALAPAPAPAAPANEPTERAAAGLAADNSASRDIALSASAQRSTLDPARPRVAGKVPRAPRPPVAPTEMPETPNRKDVAGSLDALRAALETCSDGRSGVAEVDLTINGSGTVAHALVSGDFAGTPQGSCMARALRGARFAPFQKPKFRVLYRFML